eukprot:364347-Chlamydomonas_euryale.AAC.2
MAASRGATAAGHCASWTYWSTHARAPMLLEDGLRTLRCVRFSREHTARNCAAAAVQNLCAYWHAVLRICCGRLARTHKKSETQARVQLGPFLLPSPSCYATNAPRSDSTELFFPRPTAASSSRRLTPAAFRERSQPWSPSRMILSP